MGSWISHKESRPEQSAVGCRRRVLGTTKRREYLLQQHGQIQDQ